VPQADAAARVGIGVNTVKRALADAQRRAPRAEPPAATPQPAPALRPPGPRPTPPPGDVDEPPSDDVAAPGPLLAEVDAALDTIGDDPEARILGATLRQLIAAIPVLDAVKLPQIAGAVRGLCTTLREMRPARPPAPDEIEERLRALDAPTLEEIERYTGEADKALAGRLDALKAWGAARLPPSLAEEHARLVDGLHAPPTPAPPQAPAPAGTG
jgi:hypothetical protein